MEKLPKTEWSQTLYILYYLQVGLAAHQEMVAVISYSPLKHPSILLSVKSHALPASPLIPGYPGLSLAFFSPFPSHLTTWQEPLGLCLGHLVSYIVRAVSYPTHIPSRKPVSIPVGNSTFGSSWGPSKALRS